MVSERSGLKGRLNNSKVVKEIGIEGKNGNIKITTHLKKPDGSDIILIGYELENKRIIITDSGITNMDLAFFGKCIGKYENIIKRHCVSTRGKNGELFIEINRESFSMRLMNFYSALILIYGSVYDEWKDMNIIS